MAGALLIGCTNNTQPVQGKVDPGAKEDSIKQFVYDYVEDIWNNKDFSNADKYWGPEFRNGFAPELGSGPEAMKKQVESFLEAFDPFHFEIKDIMVEGNKVSMWIDVTAIQSGDFMGIKATNKEVIFREAAWYEMKDGKFDVVYGFVDWNMLFQQLGEYPPVTGE